MEDTCPFVGPLIHLFWTSVDVCPWVSKSEWAALFVIMLVGKSPHLCASSPVYNDLLRFISSVTPPDLLAVCMSAEPFQTSNLHTSIGGARVQDWFLKITSASAFLTRMHSSMMHTARSSSHLAGVSPTAPPPSRPPWDQTPPEAGTSPPGTRPPKTRHPQTRHPPGADTSPDQAPPSPEQAPSPPLLTEFLTHTSENITLPQTSSAGSKNANVKCEHHHMLL